MKDNKTQRIARQIINEYSTLLILVILFLCICGMFMETTVIALILIVLFTANYGQIHEKMQLTRIRDRRLRYVLIAVIDVMFFMAVIAVLSFLEDLL